MNSYRKLYNLMIEAKFELMNFKLRNNTAASFATMTALTEAIVHADELASDLEQHHYETKNVFNETPNPNK